ncbi:MFS transporter [Sulfurisphaera tokodaii]|uniref:MFS transporter n=2 Tax=Sulfurisphaera tokodaii TaxID=111955 RepID=Q96XQ4_SULTO|nr:putative MFS transporter [Sulfurisphaera tokodaii str. 7]HII74573.1 MFS transporter [Sulfurisphaera tokodaii]
MMLKKIFIVFISSLSFFLSYFSRIAWSIVSVYSSLKPTVIEDGIIFSLFFIGYIIVQIPAGILSDYVSPKIIALLSLVGLALSSFISGIASNIQEEYFGSILMGLSAGWIYPVTIKILSLSFSKQELPVAIGYYSLAWPLSIVLAGLILPWISINFGWRSSYYIISFVSLITAFMFIFIRSRKGEQSKREIIVKDKNVIIISLAGFLFFLAYWIITLYAYKYFLFIGLNDYLAGIAYSLLALAGIPSTIIAGYIIRSLGVKITLSLFELFYGTLTFSLSFLTLPIYIMTISSIMGFVRFVITPANSTAVSLIGGNKAGSVTGFANFFWQSSGIIAPIVASFIILSMGYFSLWIISGLIIMISSLIYFSLLKI